MKKIFALVLTTITLFSATSCSDSAFNSKYEDPSKTATTGVPQAFTGVLYTGNRWMNPVYYRYYVQSSTSGVFSGVIGNANERGRFRGASEGYYNTRWQDFYDLLTQYRLLEDNYNKLNAAEKPSNKIFLMLGRTIMQAQLHEVLSLWGDVPYTGASTIWKTSNYAEAKAKDVYDSDVETYKQILSDLKEVGDYFAAGNLDATGVANLKRQETLCQRLTATHSTTPGNQRRMHCCGKSCHQRNLRESQHLSAHRRKHTKPRCGRRHADRRFQLWQNNVTSAQWIGPLFGIANHARRHEPANNRISRCTNRPTTATHLRPQPHGTLRGLRRHQE